jgi:DNA-binding transcriptional regulator YiaG
MYDLFLLNANIPIKEVRQMEQREIYLLKRRKLGIKMIEIAECLGVNVSTISRHERGIVKFKQEKEYMKYIDSKEKELSK